MARPRLAETLLREARYAAIEAHLAAARRTPPGEVPPWYDLAACRSTDPEIFYPPVGANADSPEVVAAKRVCNGDAEVGRPPCPVRDQCLAHAMARPEKYGIWGGMTAGERLNLRKAKYERARKARAANTPSLANVFEGQNGHANTLSKTCP